MPGYKMLDYHGNPAPTLPKPAVPPRPSVVTVQDGLAVLYSEDSLPVCGVRVVHPTNPKARSKNHSVVMLYVPPQASMDRHSHETEETYCVLSGAGKLLHDGGEQDVGAGSFIYMPPWCVHGIVNTGTEMLVALLCTAPPNP